MKGSVKMGIFDFLKKKHAGPDEEVMQKPISTPENRQKDTPIPSAAPEPAEPKDEAKRVVAEAPGMMEGKKIKYHYDHVRVFTPKELGVDFSKISPGDVVTLTPDPQNPYDKNAVQVAHALYPKLGYLNKGKIYEMANDYIRLKCPVYAHIDSIDDDRGNLTLFMAFYGSTLFQKSPAFKLTGSGSKSAQDAIMCTGEEDALDVEYDADKEKYAVYSMGDIIGYLPKAAEEYGEQTDTCLVEKIEINDNGKSEVYVYFE